jgi:peptidoglycan/xylan/chitin deacetylase (PgdA/CDA1 family)
LLKPLTDDEREPIMQQLLAWAGRRRRIRDSHRTLSAAQVRSIAVNPLIEVGTHTATHPLLAALPAASQRVEIEGSKSCLEGLLGRPVRSLAYPYGSHSLETVAIVKELGLAWACSTNLGVVTRDTDALRLPRFVVGDWSGDEFARRLKAWVPLEGSGVRG